MAVLAKMAIFCKSAHPQLLGNTIPHFPKLVKMCYNGRRQTRTLRGPTLKYDMPDPLKPPAEDRHRTAKPIVESEKPAPQEAAGVEVAPIKEEEHGELPSAEVLAIEKKSAPASAPVGRTTPAKPITPATKDELTEKIEKILEEDLYELYSKLPPEKQRAFKTKGEEAAGKIRELLAHAKVKLRKLMRIIFEWLKLLPGVNRYFLEQEAKIKADKILKIAK